MVEEGRYEREDEASATAAAAAVALEISLLSVPFLVALSLLFSNDSTTRTVRAERMATAFMIVF